MDWASMGNMGVHPRVSRYSEQTMEASIRSTVVKLQGDMHQLTNHDTTKILEMRALKIDIAGNRVVGSKTTKRATA